MSVSLRAAGIAAALLAASASPAAAQAVAPPTLAGTDLSTPQENVIVAAARCSTSHGFAAFSATGTAANGDYVGAYREEATARLQAGGLSEDLELRPLREAGHLFAIESDQGTVLGTQRAVDQVDAASCAKPFFESNLYLSYFPNTDYTARIETPLGVYVDRGEGYVEVDIVEAVDGVRTANTKTVFESSTEGVTQLLRRHDCRRGGYAELAYSSKRQCRTAANANPAA